MYIPEKSMSSMLLRFPPICLPPGSLPIKKKKNFNEVKLWVYLPSACRRAFFFPFVKKK